MAEYRRLRAPSGGSPWKKCVKKRKEENPYVRFVLFVVTHPPFSSPSAHVRVAEHVQFSPSPILSSIGSLASPQKRKPTSSQPPILVRILLLVRIVVALARHCYQHPISRVRARANILVPRPGAPADAPAHAAALAPVLHATRRVVALPHFAAQPARARRVVGAAEGAAAPLPHALDGVRVALPGSPTEVPAGVAHVDVAEEAAAKHLH